LRKLLGTINWVRPYLGITNTDLSPFFNPLKGHSALTSPRSLTKEAKQVLSYVEKAISQRKVHRQLDNQQIHLFILVTLCQTYGLIGQCVPSLSDPPVIL
ncbi:POK18 protein, partial [Pitta sordida]|nr:POK18 protein [Pitta sordida]